MQQWHHGICGCFKPHLRPRLRLLTGYPGGVASTTLAAWGHHQPSTARTASVSSSIPTLYPVPDAVFRAAMLASLAFAFNPGLDTSAIRAGSAAIWQAHAGCLPKAAQGPAIRHRPVPSGPAPPRSPWLARAAGQTGHSASGMFRVAAALNRCCRPRLPTRTIRGRTGSVMFPRCPRFSLQHDRFVALYVCNRPTAYTSRLPCWMQTVNPSQHFIVVQMRPVPIVAPSTSPPPTIVQPKLTSNRARQKSPCSTYLSEQCRISR